MSKITSLEPQKKDKTRLSVFIDGRFYCGIKLEVAVKYKLKSVMDIDSAELDKIQLETEKSEALEKAVSHLSATPKTCRQMRDFLTSKGYVEAVVSFVMQKLEYYGYTDDAAYAKNYVESVNGKSKRVMYAELLKRGIDGDVIDEALKNYEDDAESILALLKKYMRGKEKTVENVYKGCRYLVSKGYGYDDVKAARDAFLQDEDN